MPLFVVATTLPTLLIALAAGLGGIWPWLAFFYIAVLVACLDRMVSLLGHDGSNADPEAEFPNADTLLLWLGIAHPGLLILCVWAVGGGSGLSGVERLLLAVAAGLLFGQISHPVAHELIHKPARALRLLGRVVYSSILIGHHASAHLLIHHVHVASNDDPNSARHGVGFYAFLINAVPSSFHAALRAETHRMIIAGKPMSAHPFVIYAGVSAVTFVLSYLVAGWTGCLALIFIAIYAQSQIFLSDYVQHYGLRRERLENGRLEPVGPQHSWNAKHAVSSAMMVNAPRHSDHHVVPNRIYPALQLAPQTMPMLPSSLPVMAVVALIPPLWRKIMDPLSDQWSKAPLPDARPGAGDNSQPGPNP